MSKADNLEVCNLQLSRACKWQHDGWHVASACHSLEQRMPFAVPERAVLCYDQSRTPDPQSGSYLGRRKGVGDANDSTASEDDAEVGGNGGSRHWHADPDCIPCQKPDMDSTMD